MLEDRTGLLIQLSNEAGDVSVVLMRLMIQCRNNTYGFRKVGNRPMILAETITPLAKLMFESRYS